MHFGPGPFSPILLNGVPLPCSSAVKDLGIQISSDLSCDRHVQMLTAKARAVSHRILRCFRSRDPITLGRAFVAYVRPILEYAFPVLSLSAAQLASIESVQRRFTWQVCKRLDKAETNYEDRLKLCGLQMMTSRRELSDLTFAHSVFHARHLCPPLKPIDPKPRYPTSHRMRFATERKPSRLRSRLAPYRISRKWNALSDAVRGLKTTAFKKNVSET